MSTLTVPVPSLVDPLVHLTPSLLEERPFELGQLLDDIRRGLISRLSYRLQTPLSTIQTAVETLAEGDMIPAQAQRSLLDLALSELRQTCRSVEVLLADATQIWSMTLDSVQFRADPAATPCLNSVSTVLLEDSECSQPWMEAAGVRLNPDLSGIGDEGDEGIKLNPLLPVSISDQESRDVFAIVNHELRTPFTTIRKRGIYSAPRAALGLV